MAELLARRFLAVLFVAALIGLAVAGGQIQALDRPGTAAGADVAVAGASIAESVPDANTVDAGCTPGTSDCAKRISDAIKNNRARPLKVTFGANSASGSQFTFATEIRMNSNVAIEGLNQPVVTSKARSFARIGNLSNIAFSGFDIDLDRCRKTKNVFLVGADQRITNLHVSNMRVFDGDATVGTGGGSCVLLASRGQGDQIHLANVSAERLRRVLWFNVTSNHSNVSVTNMVASEFGYQALTFDGYVENVLIENSQFSRHARNVKGSHIIAFSPAETLQQVKSRNVVVRNSLLEGWPDTPHIKTDGVTTPNGASGDLIAIRGTDGFLLEGNTFRHGGEVGITITAGAKNGIVRHNTVSFTDTTGIVLGNGNTIRVTNVDVYGNELFQNSLDRANALRPLPALSVWGATDSCVVHNDIHDNTKATGLWVWNGHLPPHWPRSVKDVYITENQFRNNLHDFVQSKRPLRDFEPASSYGGENWTSTFGTADADGDGFGAVCSSETDDNDPCAPFAGAPACNGPVPPPTTASTTTAPPTTEATTTTAPPTTEASTTTAAPTTTAGPSTTAGPTTTAGPSTTAPTTTAGPSTTAGPTTTEAPPGTAPTETTGPAPQAVATCNGLPATIVGTEGDDVIFGTNGRDVIVGLGGDDIIHGRNGPDVICGGEGEDELRGGRHNDVIFGGPDDDLIKGGRDNDTLMGEDGNDEMFGNNGRDTIEGGKGNDTARGNGGRDVISGGDGHDYLAGNGDVDQIVGDRHNDILLGGSRNDTLSGGSGRDGCAGGTGVDTEQSCEREPAVVVDEYDTKPDDGNLD